MDVHPPKNGINRYWSIPIYIYIYWFPSLGFLGISLPRCGDLSNLVYHFVAYINSEHKTLEKHSVARLFYLSSDSFSFDSFSSLPLLTSAFPSVRIVGSLTSRLPSIISPFVPCSKCLTSWHQIRKCLRHCLRFAYAHTSVAYAHILSYAELTLAYAHQSFAYATPLQGSPS